MTRSNLPHKRDANQAEIVEVFEQLGCSVADTSALGGDFPDLVVGFAGINVMVECKTDAGKLSPGQEGFRERWRGQYAVVRSRDEAAMLVGSIRRGLWERTPRASRRGPASNRARLADALDHSRDWSAEIDC